MDGLPFDRGRTSISRERKRRATQYCGLQLCFRLQWGCNVCGLARDGKPVLLAKCQTCLSATRGLGILSLYSKCDRRHQAQLRRNAGNRVNTGKPDALLGADGVKPSTCNFSTQPRCMLGSMHSGVNDKHQIRLITPAGTIDELPAVRSQRETCGRRLVGERDTLSLRRRGGGF